MRKVSQEAYDRAKRTLFKLKLLGRTPNVYSTDVGHVLLFYYYQSMVEQFEEEKEKAKDEGDEPLRAEAGDTDLPGSLREILQIPGSRINARWRKKLLRHHEKSTQASTKVRDHAEGEEV